MATFTIGPRRFGQAQILDTKAMEEARSAYISEYGCEPRPIVHEYFKRTIIDPGEYDVGVDGDGYWEKQIIGYHLDQPPRK